MKLTIVYDNDVMKTSRDLISDWGFSCVLETGSEIILFDSGADGRILMHNMNQLDLEPDRIDRVVVSHEHWDHSGGLKSLVKINEGLPIHRLAIDPDLSGTGQKRVDEGGKISGNVYTTGPLYSDVVPEQSLYIRGKDGIYILTGCSHSGINNILKSVTGDPIVGIIGGFHGFDHMDHLEGLSLICPAHCTKLKDQILRRYPESAIPAGVGRIIEIEPPDE